MVNAYNFHNGHKWIKWVKGQNIYDNFWMVYNNPKRFKMVHNGQQIGAEQSTMVQKLVLNVTRGIKKGPE